MFPTIQQAEAWLQESKKMTPGLWDDLSLIHISEPTRH